MSAIFVQKRAVSLLIAGENTGGNERYWDCANEAVGIIINSEQLGKCLVGGGDGGYL